MVHIYWGSYLTLPRQVQIQAMHIWTHAHIIVLFKIWRNLIQFWSWTLNSFVVILGIKKLIRLSMLYLVVLKVWTSRYKAKKEAAKSGYQSKHLDFTYNHHGFYVIFKGLGFCASLFEDFELASRRTQIRILIHVPVRHVRLFLSIDNTFCPTVIISR